MAQKSSILSLTASEGLPSWNIPSRTHYWITYHKHYYNNDKVYISCTLDQPKAWPAHECIYVLMPDLMAQNHRWKDHIIVLHQLRRNRLQCLKLAALVKLTSRVYFLLLQLLGASEPRGASRGGAPQGRGHWVH